MYSKYFDDEGMLTKDLNEIYSYIGLTVESKVDIKRLVEIQNRCIDNFARVDTIGVWLEESVTDTALVNGQKKIIEHKGAHVGVYRAKDGEYYFGMIVPDLSDDPCKVVMLNDDIKTFRFKKRWSDHVYELLPNSMLVCRDEKGEMVRRYFPKPRKK